jgi:di/tricarboxylate transporter
MTWPEILTLAVIAAAVIVLVRDLAPPSATLLGATVLLLVAGVIDAGQAFSGFSNPAPITVAALYVLARAVHRTGLLQPLLTRTLGETGRERGALLRLLLPTAGASAFLNNTPIVAMLVPTVTEWSHRRGLSPSRFLMPLSFAAILGGMVTAIGTSTNLVVSGLMQSHGLEPMGLFEIGRIGLPVALLGLLFLVLAAPRLLAERRVVRAELEENIRRFVVQMRVVPGGPLDGRTIAQGGLRHLQGVFLVEVERAGERLAPVGPEAVLHGEDLLTFVGKADLIVDLQGMSGLVSTEQQHLAHFDTARHTFYEVVVGAESPLVGRTLRDVSFRGRYNAAVVAIHRAGQRVQAKLGDVRLRVGDTLLVLTDPGFGQSWRDRNDFLLVSRLGGAPPAVSRKSWLVALVGVGIVVLSAAGIMPILHAALLGAIGLVLLGVMSPGEARDAVDLNVIIVIAAAFGLGTAIESTGLAADIARLLLGAFGTFGPTGALLGVVLATLVLTELITNNAAAVLLFPIALATAQQTGLDPRPFAMGIAIAASASFLTPIGYQTNTMVYGAGGYRFGDYARLGFPLTLVVILTTVALVPVFWPF